MSKCLLILFFFPTIVFSQSEGKVWTELGIKGSLHKKIDWGVELTNRFGSRGLETFFPQATLKYKVTKWFRPSIDYRLISNKEDNGNRDLTHRLNFNGDFKHVMDRFETSFRIRYQYSFDHISQKNYDVEFDHAIRLKPALAYDINDFFLTPGTSVEFFYDPTFSSLGRRFTKYRLWVGAELDLNSAHEISFGYILDQQINLPDPNRKHILSLSYTYNLGFEKENKKD